MELSIGDYYTDLFESFKYDKEAIDEQITRDLPRMSLYMNGTKITTKNLFYSIINNLHYNSIYKRLIWILPTQVSLFLFYNHLNNIYKKQDYLVAEISEGDKYSNGFFVYIDTIDSKNINIIFKKNFRLLYSKKNREIQTVGYVFCNIIISLKANSKVKMTYEEYKV